MSAPSESKTVTWFETIVASDEFKKACQKTPETLGVIGVHNVPTADGGKRVLLTSTMQEVVDVLPKIIDGLKPDRPNILILKRTAHCLICAEKKQESPQTTIRCTHACLTENKLFAVDIEAFLKSKSP